MKKDPLGKLIYQRARCISLQLCKNAGNYRGSMLGGERAQYINTCSGSQRARHGGAWHGMLCCRHHMAMGHATRMATRSMTPALREGRRVRPWDAQEISPPLT